MQIRRNEELERQFVDGLSAISANRPSSGTRSVGPHVSGIIQDIAYQMELLRRPTLSNSDDPTSLFAVGFVWEDAIGKQLAILQGIQLGQFECVVDGIIGTPDRYRPGTGEIDEFKATWMSTSHDIMGEKFWRWWAQVKAYCYMLNAYWANIYAFHVNGDYRPPRPDTRVYSALFTKLELSNNWALITNHNQKMVRERGEWWLTK